MITKISSILDYSYPFLDPAVWDQDMKLYSYQKDFILRLLDKMYSTYNLVQHEKWVDDVVILGSLTTTKWLLSSDLDVHVRVNLDEFIKTNMPDASKEEAFTKLDETRKEFDRAKILAPMTQHPTEFYMESLELHPSNTEAVGVYSIYQNKWLKEPISLPAELDIEESKRKVIEEAEALAQELDGSLGKVKRDIQRIDELENVIKAWGKDKQKLFYTKIEKKLDDIEEEIKKDLKIKQDLVDYRHSNQDPTSENEILFKYLARNGFFAILQNLKELLESTDGEVTVDELPLIEKVISEASLDKKSDLDSEYWIEPNGTLHMVGDHKSFIADQGYLDIDEVESDPNAAIFYMLENGWVRIGMGNIKNVQFVIELEDVNNIPSFLDNYVTKWYNSSNPERLIEISDINGNYLVLDNPFPSFQKAIRKELQQKRLQTASIKQAGQVTRLYTPEGLEVRVFKNPTPTQAENLWLKSRDHVLRYVGTGQDVYMWDAYMAEHYTIMKLMGLLEHHGGEGTIQSMSEARNVAERFTKRLQTASMDKKAFVSQKCWLDPNGKEYWFSTGVTHEEWAWKNIDLLRNKYNPDFSNGDHLFYEMLKDGWTRVHQESPECQFYFQVQSSQNLPSYLDDFVAKYYNPNDDRAIGIADANEDYSHRVREPFPSLQKAVKKSPSLVISQMSKFASFMKKAQVKPTSEDNPALGQCYIDLDDTLATENPDGSIGNLIEGAKEALDVLKQNGWNIVIYSYRSNVDEDAVKEFLDKNNLSYDSIFIGKPAYQVLIDDRAIKFNDNWKELVTEIGKPEKKASLHISSSPYNYRSEKLWIDPSGHWHQVGGSGSHAGWILDNAQLLKDEFGFDSSSWTRDSNGDIKDFVGLDQALIKTGWVRVGDTDSGWGIEVKDLRNIPDFVRGMLIGNRGEVTFEGVDGDYVIVDINDYVTQGQKAINKALQRQRMIHASLSQKYWLDPSGKEYVVEGKIGWNPIVGHLGWVEGNEELLTQTYGFEFPDQYWKKSQGIDEIIETMLLNGWTRVTNESEHDFDIEISDLNSIPPYLDDFVARHFKGQGIGIDDIDGNYVLVSDPFPSLQKSVNKELSLTRVSSQDLPIIDHKTFNRTEPYALFIGTGDYGEAGKIDLFNVYGQHPMITKSNAVPTVTLDTLVKNNIPVIGKEPRAGDKRPYHDISSVVKQAQTKKVKQGEYSAIMAVVPHDIAQEIVEWGVRNIKDKDVYSDKDNPRLGRELEPHITVKYGLLTDDIKSVRQFFNDEKPFKAKLGKVRHFEPPETDFDVVTVEVVSEDLERINKEVTDHFECAEGLVSDEYHPHITVSYVGRGKGKDYIGSSEFEGKEIILDTLIVSPRKGNRTYFSISQDKESRFVLEQINKFAARMESTWITPDGEIIPVDMGNHASWVADNLDWLSSKYGSSFVRDYYEEAEIEEGDTERALYDIVLNLVAREWTRVFQSSDAISYQIRDLSNPPKNAEDFFIQHIEGFNDINVGDLSGNSVNIQEPELGFVKGIQKGLQQKRLQPAAKQASGNNFYPSLVQAPNNEWQFEHGGDDLEIPVDPDPVSDEETYYAPCTVGKPRNPDMWKSLWHMIKSPFSKKEVESASDTEQEAIEQKELGGETLLEYSKSFKDLNRLDTNKPKTTWPDNSSSQGGEPYAPLPSFHVETNPDNENWRYPWKFTSRPRGEDSDDGKTIEMLREQEKRKACIEKITREITAGNTLDINGKRVYKNPTLLQSESLLKNSKDKSLRGLIDPLTTDLYVWDAWEMEHQPVINYLGIEAGTEGEYIYIWNMFSEQDLDYLYEEINKIKRQRKKVSKQAGSYSASVPDYQGEQYYNEQHMNDTDSEPYVNHDQRDYPYGMHDSPENTDSGIGWAKDNSPQTVFLDVLNKPFNRTDPAGMDWYSVILYESLPSSQGIESVNPD